MVDNRPIGRASHQAQEAAGQGKGAHCQNEYVGPRICHLAVRGSELYLLYVRQAEEVLE